MYINTIFYVLLPQTNISLIKNNKQIIENLNLYDFFFFVCVKIMKSVLPFDFCRYIHGLKTHLKQIYPVNVKSNQVLSDSSTLHIYYPGEINYETIFFLLTCYMLLFTYVYYTIKKMDIFVSKVIN